jgi:hypothetical protein
MSGPLQRRAIAIGAAVSIAASLVIVALGSMAGSLVETLGVVVVSWAFRLFGLAADAAAGFVAGRIAGRDGALHGLAAGVLASAVGLAISLPRALFAGFAPDAGWWLQVATWTLAGVALAFVGGALGAQSRRA